MQKIIAVMLVMFVVGAHAADTGADQAPPCKTAEINPVTGHVLCIDPLGGKVEAPPADIAPPCDAADSRGQWSWAPNCNPKIEGDPAEGM